MRKVSLMFALSDILYLQPCSSWMIIAYCCVDVLVGPNWELDLKNLDLLFSNP
jgi:hypothetical protein